MVPIQCILHPTDFSQSSDYAFRLACSLARDHGAVVVHLHVMPSFRVYGGEMGAVVVPEHDPDTLLEKLHDLQPPGALRVEPRVEEGNPVTRILETAEEIGCDLIVMGTHGRTGLTRLLMGSVADRVVRKAPCPVLTVKAPLRLKESEFSHVLEGATAP
ncbi:MAG: universal stress protein [Gemmataceae bacterium]|nr:universal stress protein [Gemmataceae bacterium]